MGDLPWSTPCNLRAIRFKTRSVSFMTLMGFPPGEIIYKKHGKGGQAIARAATAHLGATTDARLSYSVFVVDQSCSQPEPSSLGGMTKSYIPKGSDLPVYSALLRTGLLHLSIYHQIWIRKYKEALEWIHWVPNMFLPALIV